MSNIFEAIVESIHYPFVFCDKKHIIKFINAKAAQNYEKWGGYDIVGRSIFECHNENSNKIIKESYEKLVAGIEEIMIYDNDKKRGYMRAVRDKKGNFIGYYERMEYK